MIYNIKLKQAIEDLNITQRILADVSEVHETILSQVIRGSYHPSDKMKTKIATALGLPLEGLF